MKLVLDTNVYSDYAEGVPETVDFMATHGEQIYLPSVVLGEITARYDKLPVCGRKVAISHCWTALMDLK